MAEVHACECGQRVIRARTEARRWQLLDPDPDPAGNVVARQDGTGTWFCRTLHGDQKPAGGEKRFMPHRATCTAPGHLVRAVRARAERARAEPAAVAQDALFPEAGQ